MLRSARNDMSLVPPAGPNLHPITRHTKCCASRATRASWSRKGAPRNRQGWEVARHLPAMDAVGPLLWRKQFSDNHCWNCIIITVRSAALDCSCGDTAVHFYEGEPNLLHQHGWKRFSIRAKGRSRWGGTGGGLGSHFPRRAGPATSEGRLPGIC